MYIPFWWSQQAQIPNLAYLRESLAQYGGSVVQYNRVFSALVFSQRTPHFEWVPPGGSRVKPALPHIRYCLKAGWWSIQGLFINVPVIINNLCGGVDVTFLFVDDPTNKPVMDARTREARDRMERDQTRSKWVLYSLLAVEFVAANVGAFLLVDSGWLDK